MPKQRAEVRSAVVRRSDEAAVHVCVAAGLLGEGLAEGCQWVWAVGGEGEDVVVLGGDGEVAGEVLSVWEVGVEEGGDAEGFAGCVVVCCWLPVGGGGMCGGLGHCCGSF